MPTLQERISALPPALQEQVREFLDGLERQSARNPAPVRQDWAGALGHLKDQYTSLELQKKALEWWADSD